MQLKEFNLILDIKKHIKQDYIEVVQGDSYSNVVNISLIDGLKPFDLTNTLVEIVFKKSDGTTVMQNDVIVVNATQGELQCTLKTNTIASQGKTMAEVRVLEGEVLLTSARFEFYVRNSLVDDETIESTNEFPILQKLVNDVDGVIASEADRVTNEATRKTSETSRINAETARVVAEQNRSTVFQGYETRVSGVENDLTQHKFDYMPHRFQDIKNKKKYRFGFQISSDGNPQIIFEEVL